MKDSSSKVIAAIVLSVIGIMGIVALFLYLNYKKTHISTDDAFVTGRIHVIAAKIPGTVKGIQVDDNQQVKSGDLLVEIDEKDYDVQVREAESSLHAERSRYTEILASIDVGRKRLSELTFTVASQRAKVELEMAKLDQAGREAKRAEALFCKR